MDFFLNFAGLGGKGGPTYVFPRNRRLRTSGRYREGFPPNSTGPAYDIVDESIARAAALLTAVHSAEALPHARALVSAKFRTILTNNSILAKHV